ncbi:hypothetical protein AQUCO_10000018v1 [Aquilegia coerulea]|uniref:Uncharacterized protein n=1 Tax=Aquilegia coerulea TaxID=218851 RepID=A0A2G5C428_AQUCA|nr:hypothetical protein AQUCO_10000018v1 [Aquilegia coerulea]
MADNNCHQIKKHFKTQKHIDRGVEDEVKRYKGLGDDGDDNERNQMKKWGSINMKVESDMNIIMKLNRLIRRATLNDGDCFNFQWRVVKP